jgi:hypothetical protein
VPLLYLAAISPGGLVGAVIAGLLGCAAVAFVANRRASEPTLDGETPRSAGGRFEWTWTRSRGYAPLEDIAQRLQRDASMRQERHNPSHVVLKGGSQLWTRMFGGYFVDPRRLPVEVDLRGVANSNGAALTVTVRDRMGPALRDARMRERYAERAANIRELILGV